MMPMTKRRMRGSAILRTLLVCLVVGLAVLFATGWEGIMHSISMSPSAAGTAPSTSEDGSIGLTSSRSPVGGPALSKSPQRLAYIVRQSSSTNDIISLNADAELGINGRPSDIRSIYVTNDN